VYGDINVAQSYVIDETEIGNYIGFVEDIEGNNL
jgi:hypothetical protein